MLADDSDGWVSEESDEESEDGMPPEDGQNEEDLRWRGGTMHAEFEAEMLRNREYHLDAMHQS